MILEHDLYVDILKSSSITLPSSQNWSAIASSGSLFVAIVNGSSTTARSSDGITWTTGSIGTSDNWQDICYGNGKFVAISSFNYATSSDGIYWTVGALPYISVHSTSYVRVASNNSLFVVIGNSSSGGYYAASSSDGITWTPSYGASSLGTPTTSWNCITSNRTSFIAISNYIIGYSTNGTSWTTGPAPNMSSNQSWSAVAPIGTRYVAIAYGTNIAAYCDNIIGGNWIQTSLPTTDTWTRIISNGNTLLATAQSGSAAISINGIEWNSISLGSYSWYGCSSNGLQWNVSTDPIIAVAYGTNSAARITTI